MAEGSLGGCVAGVVVIADFLELRDRCLVSLLSIVPVIGGTSMVINLRQDYALPPSCLWPESGSHIVPPWLIDCGRIVLRVVGRLTSLLLELLRLRRCRCWRSAFPVVRH